MSLREQLGSPDDNVRLAAADAAADQGGPELIDLLLDLALHDPAEVRTTGGVAEVWRTVGDAAAQGLKGVLDRQGGLDDRVLRAVTDPAEDDRRVGRLLYFLGEHFEPVRRDLETSGDERLRVRALYAVVAHRRPAELNRRLLADTSAQVRIEVLQGGTGLEVADVEPLLTDPDPQVRRAAVKWLRWADSSAFAATARWETDRTVRQAYVDGLVSRALTPPVRDALVSYLADDDGHTENQAAVRLQQVDDPGVAAAIASRILVRTDERRLTTLVRYPYLLKYAPELRDPLEHMHRCTPDAGLRGVLEKVLADVPSPYRQEDDGLDVVQQARLLREVLGWADRAPALAAAPDNGLAAWVAAPDDRTANDWIVEHDWFGTGPVAELLHAAVDGDLRRALAVDVPPRVLRLAHLFTARQIRAGLNPLRPGPVSPMLTHGPEALRVGLHRGGPGVVHLHATVVLETGFRPQYAVLHVDCSRCGVAVRIEGPVPWERFDAVRTAAELIGLCPACAGAARAEVHLALNRDARTLTWTDVR